MAKPKLLAIARLKASNRIIRLANKALRKANQTLRREAADSKTNSEWHSQAKAAFVATARALIDPDRLQRVCLYAHVPFKDVMFSDEDQRLRRYIRTGTPSLASKVFGWPLFANQVRSPATRNASAAGSSASR